MIMQADRGSWWKWECWSKAGWTVWCLVVGSKRLRGTADRSTVENLEMDKAHVPVQSLTQRIRRMEFRIRHDLQTQHQKCRPRSAPQLARTIKPCDGARDATSGNTDKCKGKLHPQKRKYKKKNIAKKKKRIKG